MKNKYITNISIFCFFIFVAGTIDLGALFNYGNQSIPSYIDQDNTPSDNPITDEGATLGRVLFFDTNLSLTNIVSCGSCHKQLLAFGDSEIQSVGHDGALTGRHSPRLSSARFSEEENFFWDERANSLEKQATMPIQDHVEMGFSGLDGNPDIDSLISKLENIYYYDELFNLAFGDQIITEERMQDALAQFVRSMQSFDSRYDVGRGQVGNDNANFPNFTAEENSGKSLYMNNNGAGCNSCHRAPEFDIDPNSNNNGIVGIAGVSGGVDVSNVRSPSLRDIVNASGVENGPYMHDGSLATLTDVINHYDDIPNNPNNNNLDNRLQGNGGNLNLSNTEKAQLLAFLKTLGGSELYTNVKWSDPFDADGSLELLNGVLPIELSYFQAISDGDFVELEWETEIEFNNEGFEVLRSSNSTDWEVLEFVEGKNESTLYKHTDYNPAAGNNYYRLKQVDLDGQFELSEIRMANVKREDTEISIYPNPSYDFVNVEASENMQTALFYDINGRVVKEANISDRTRVDISNLESGGYFIKMIGVDGSISSVSRIVKL